MTPAEFLELFQNLPYEFQEQFVDLAFEAGGNAVWRRLYSFVELIDHLEESADVAVQRCRALLRQQRRKPGRKANRDTPAILDKITQQHESGMSWAEINRRHKKSSRWAQNLLKKHGRKPSRG